MGYILELRKSVGTRPLIMVGAAVIVRNDKGEILLQKRSDSFDWGTIGGSMEPGETFEETAARELYEEAGLRAQTLKVVSVLTGEDMYYKYPNGDEIYNVVAVVEAAGLIGEPTVSDDEGLDLQYFSLQEQIDNLNPMSKTILTRAGYLPS